MQPQTFLRQIQVAQESPMKRSARQIYRARFSKMSDADKPPQLLQQLRRPGPEFSGSPWFIQGSLGQSGQGIP